MIRKICLLLCILLLCMPLVRADEAPDTGNSSATSEASVPSSPASSESEPAAPEAPQGEKKEENEAPAENSRETQSPTSPETPVEPAPTGGTEQETEPSSSENDPSPLPTSPAEPENTRGTDQEIIPEPEPTERAKPANLFKMTLKALERMTPPDYDEPSSWYLFQNDGENEADVIFLLPTCWKRTPGQCLLCDISQEKYRSTIDTAYKWTASVFEGVANIYIPFYRQIDSGYALRQDADYMTDLLLLASVPDVFRALDHYFEVTPSDRPFILAAHSQGSQILLYVLSDYMTLHPQYLDRMIAAYVVGYSVTRDFMAQNPHLTFGSEPYQTGVVVSWNTEVIGLTENNPVLLPDSLCVNPISFTDSAEYVDNKLSLGANINGEKVEHFADAVIDLKRHCVACTTVNPKDFHTSNSFPVGSLHGYDYAFYYYDIRENVRLRIISYLLTH